VTNITITNIINTYKRSTLHVYYLKDRKKFS